MNLRRSALLKKYKILNSKKLLATAFADLMGRVIFAPLVYRNSKRRELGEIKKILIIRTAYLGDVVMTLPMLKPIREGFPDSKISFLTSDSALPILKNNPFVDNVFAYNPFWFYNSPKNEYFSFIRKIRAEGEFDLVIETKGDLREILMLAFPVKSRLRLSYGFGGGEYLLSHVVPFNGIKHRVEYNLDIARYLGCRTDTLEWGLYHSEGEKSQLERKLKSVKRPFIAVHPGARLPLKCWNPVKFANLLDILAHRHGVDIMIVGTDEETKLAMGIASLMKKRPHVKTGEISVRELAGILGQSSLVICNDSAPMHLAACMKAPVVAIFGPSKSIETAPYACKHRIVEKEFPCRELCDENFCRNGEFHACMASIEVEDVLNAVEGLLAETGIR